MNLFSATTVRQKLLLGTAALALIPIVLATVLLGRAATDAGRTTIQQQARDQLTATREVKKEQILDYFANAKAQIGVLAKAPDVVNAMREFTAAYPKFDEQAKFDKSTLERYYSGDFNVEYGKRNRGQKADTNEFMAKQGADATALQAVYIGANSNKLGEKFKLESSTDGSDYSKLHTRFHPGLPSATIQKFGYYDFFLVDQAGNVVYTYFKELDFASNLNEGPWAKSGLGDAFRAGWSAADGDVKLTDYAPYIPSYNDEASFISTPIFDGAQRIGVLVLQLPLDQVNKVMTYDKKWKESGLGDSGETYLIGNDFKSRTVARFFVDDKPGYLKALTDAGLPKSIADLIDAKNSNVGLQQVNSAGAKEAIAGKSGFQIYPDYRNIPVLGAYAPIDVLGLKWGILSEIDESEAFAPIDHLNRTILYWALGILLAMLAAAALLSRALVRTVTVPLGALEGTVKQLATGDFGARSPIKTQDEFGQFSTSFNNLLDDRVATLAKAEETNKRNEAAILRLMNELGDVADGDLTARATVSEDITGAIADSVNYTVGELEGVVSRINTTASQVSTATESAQQTSRQLLSAAESQSRQIADTTKSVLSVATAIGNVSENAAQSVNVARQSLEAAEQGSKAVQNSIAGMNDIRDQIQDTSKRIKRLGESSQEIGEIVELIADITDQTNILALNAAIQAASAGEAGRGFSVVAEEVQRLAERSGEATKRIGALVRTIQGDTQEAIAAMERSTQGVVQGAKVSDAAGQALAEIERRSREVSALIDSVASTAFVQSEMAKEVAENMQGILEITQQTTDGTKQTAASVESLTAMADELRSSVSRFKAA
jgi:methyl-accepting chemotaxis protein